MFCYNFCLDSNKKTYQPSGSMNLNRFKTIDFEFHTITPEKTDSVDRLEEFICDEDNNPISFRKNISKLYKYTYNLRVFEERYNVIIIQSGRCGLLHAI